MANEEAWFERMIQRPQDQQIMVIEICPKREWIPIGTCGYHEIDWRSRNTEVGISIGAKEWWNKGYGSEAMELMVKYGFEMLNMHRIWLRVFERNKRAIRSYEKVGFVHEGSDARIGLQGRPVPQHPDHEHPEAGISSCRLKLL